MNTDYLIIGQGIAGTLLSRELMLAGSRVVVVDDGNAAAASKVASGVITPVTGKRLVRTWLADTLLPYAYDYYTEMGGALGVRVLRQLDVLDFHPSQERSSAFSDKLAEESQYLHRTTDEAQWSDYFRFNYGIGVVAPCLLVDSGLLLEAWRRQLAASGSLLEERFGWEKCEVSASGVVYKDITAAKIILCDGTASVNGPYFNMLPWSKDKGEAIIASIPGLQQDHIYKQGFSIVPWRDDLFWVGATHDWKYTDMLPSAAFRKQTEELLDYWLKLPYKIIDHIVARRPVNLDRKPFVGLHPLHPSVGIFNGMGTKGYSVAPFFARQFARHLVNGEPLMAEVDVRRFGKILSR